MTVYNALSVQVHMKRFLTLVFHFLHEIVKINLKKCHIRWIMKITLQFQRDKGVNSYTLWGRIDDRRRGRAGLNQTVDLILPDFMDMEEFCFYISWYIHEYQIELHRKNENAQHKIVQNVYSNQNPIKNIVFFVFWFYFTIYIGLYEIQIRVNCVFQFVRVNIGINKYSLFH